MHSSSDRVFVWHICSQHALHIKMHNASLSHFVYSCISAASSDSCLQSLAMLHAVTFTVLACNTFAALPGTTHLLK